MSALFQLNSLREYPSLKAILYYSSQDLHAQYGLRHFLNKYNFAAADNPQNADVCIGYSASEGLGSKTQILLSSTAKDGCCFLRFEDKVIPFFKQPVKTDSGRYLVMAEDHNQPYPCITISDKKINIGFDIFAETGRTLAGCYDALFLKNDKPGKYLKATPIVDVLEEILFSAIRRLRPDLCPNPGFSWPDGHQFAMVLTHDVDRIYKTHQYLRSILSSSVKADLSGLSYHTANLLFKHGRNNPFWTFDSVCSLEDSLGVKSTFFFLQETGRVNPFNPKSWGIYHGRYDIRKSAVKNTICRLDEQGYEIGVHGSYRSYKNPVLLKKEKSLMESITGSEAAGIRQHFLNYDRDVTPSLHHICGFKYDTSIGFRPGQGMGFRRGTSFPFPIMSSDGRELPVLELPLIIMDTAIGPAAAGEECFDLMRQVEKYRGVFTVLWHQNTLNKKEFPFLSGLYETLIMEARKRGAWIATAREVYHWITAQDQFTDTCQENYKPGSKSPSHME
ncbi:MAG: polysaccharide deacetylase family protein [Dehalococcoidales bacterium]|nr:polysaccharide deacetylase family protein [Dehalococcoidales bacterium]